MGEARYFGSSRISLHKGEGANRPGCKELVCLLGYLEDIKEEVMVLEPKKAFGLDVYIDASFSGHP